MKEQNPTAPGATAAEPQAAPAQIIAAPARLRPRHYGLGLFFVLCVVMPLLVAGLYLFLIAEDQYESRVGFSVRKEEASSPLELLGGIGAISGSSSSDTDFLYKYIGGREMIRAVDAKLDLSTIYNRPSDPVFSLPADATIEDLERFWHRVVKVFYSNSDGLLEVRVVAFAPQDAQNIAQAILGESSTMINELTAIARQDTTRYAHEELDRSIDRLKDARQAMTRFRARTQIVDPAADIAGKMGLLNTLQAQLAAALIELDLLLKSTSGSDPRINQVQQRVVVIQERIDAERDRFSKSESSETDPYSDLVSEYEALSVDLEFAQSSYLTTLATYDVAVGEAQRKSRYLAAYISPTLAESAQYPRRFMLLFLIGTFLAIGWSIVTLVYYSLRDRR